MSKSSPNIPDPGSSIHQDDVPRKETDLTEDRRRILGVGIAVGSMVFAAPLIVCAGAFLRGGSPSQQGERWVPTVKVATLADGEARKVVLRGDVRDAWFVRKDVDLGSVWLVRRGDRVVGYSATCPHLGCAVEAKSGSMGFECPCHTSAFDAEGKRVSGPAPRDLDALGVRVVAGIVEVDFRRFKTGVAEKAEVG